MRKSKFSDGSPFFGIKIEHFVSKTVFANAIASYCWEEEEEFDPRSTKKEVMKILKLSLLYHGNAGLYREHWDGASEEFVAHFEDAYKAAIEWIEKNYPYLSA